MRITVVGAGNVGGTLASRWSAAGHRVVFGARDPGSAKVAAWLARVPALACEAPDVALAGAEAVLLALPAAAVAGFAEAYGRELDGKVVIDATNKFGEPVVNSLAYIVAAAPGARPYRAFNSLGWENYADPVVAGQQADLLFCGADGPGRQIVERLIADIGLRPVWVGGLEYAPDVDAIGRIWVALALRQNRGRRLVFKMLGA
jgi:8-hydroxy-5-deazaflavin:NADPH oxidoreductase